MRKPIVCRSNINIIEAKKKKKKKMKNFQSRLLKAGFCLLGSALFEFKSEHLIKFWIICFGNINLTFADVLISDYSYGQIDQENALCFVLTRKTATQIKNLSSAKNNGLQQLCPCVQVINNREFRAIKICFMCTTKCFTLTWFSKCTLPKLTKTCLVNKTSTNVKYMKLK